MKSCTRCNILITAAGVVGLLVISAAAVPVGNDEDRPESTLVERADLNEVDPVSWDNIDVNALRKLLMQLENDDRYVMSSRSIRSWPQPAPRAYARSVDNKLVRQWRADKRQVRFRQCYFNPISCFRK